GPGWRSDPPANLNYTRGARPLLDLRSHVGVGGAAPAAAVAAAVVVVVVVADIAVLFATAPLVSAGHATAMAASPALRVASSAATSPHSYYVASLDGPIDPGAEDFVSSAIGEAEAAGANHFV